MAFSTGVITHEPPACWPKLCATSKSTTELAKLVQLGRLELDLDNADTVRVLSALHVWPIDLAIAVESTRLDYTGDPADELIGATAAVHNVPLLTRDKRIRASNVVPLA